MLWVREVPGHDQARGEAYPALRARLEKHVQELSVPRHFKAQAKQNERVGAELANRFESFGYRVERQGPFGNVLALPPTPAERPVLVGAHFDSVPFSPGADDNASAVAVMLEAARATRSVGVDVGFVAFNREEDGLKGSDDFVAARVVSGELVPSVVHVLEMVGYTDRHPKSQRKPFYLPIRIPSTGDFLGIISNKSSGRYLDQVLDIAKASRDAPRVVSLRTAAGIERLLFDLLRSDHVAFWKRAVPALMWTDTANFRNPNYHRASDTPDTLDYGFMTQVCLLLVRTLGVPAERLAEAVA